MTMIQTILDRLSEEGYLEGLLKIKPAKKEPGMNIQPPENPNQANVNPAPLNEGEDFFENNKPIEELTSGAKKTKPNLPVSVANGEKVKGKAPKPVLEKSASPPEDILDDSAAKPLDPAGAGTGQITPFEAQGEQPQRESVTKAVARRKKITTAAAANRKTAQN